MGVLEYMMGEKPPKEVESGTPTGQVSDDIQIDTVTESEAQEAKQEIITNEEISSQSDVAQPEADEVQVPVVEEHTEIAAEPIEEKELPTEGELVINAPVDLAIPYEVIESLSFDEVKSIFYIKLVGAESNQSIKVRGSIGRQAYRYVRSEGYKVAII